MDDLGKAVTDAASSLLGTLTEHVPSLVVALLVLLLGWIVARVMRVLAMRGMQVIETLIGRATGGPTGIDMRGSATVFGTIVLWAVLLFFITAATQILGLVTFTQGLARLIEYLPSLIAGLPFESLMAKFTALAVLLPVVAGQSGNAGAQALAVTMRGLVLREISLRHWPGVVGKEALTGLVNGLAVAATTAIGVFVWSRSPGLVLIIVVAMVISMVAAGLAGALVPILLRRFGQDPATASSIILTTVTDVVGFLSFLGIATLLAPMLEAGAT
jgi:cation transporter-like permease